MARSLAVARLILGGMGGSDLPFLDAVLRALGGRRTFDLAGAHPYRFPPVAPDVLKGTNLAGGGSAQLLKVSVKTFLVDDATLARQLHELSDGCR